MTREGRRSRHCAGLGRKSAACVLLLALGMRDFPVDTNVGRICARLGWIPLDSEQALEARRVSQCRLSEPAHQLAFCYCLHQRHSMKCSCRRGIGTGRGIRYG